MTVIRALESGSASSKTDPYLRSLPLAGDIVLLVITPESGGDEQGGFARVLAVSPDRRMITISGLLPDQPADATHIDMAYLTPEAFASVRDMDAFLAAAGAQVWADELTVVDGALRQYLVPAAFKVLGEAW